VSPVKLPSVQGLSLSIICDRSYGPSFGGGIKRVSFINDLHVADCANRNTTSYTNPGNVYQLPPGQAAQTFFTGAHHFQAAEVEVYQVVRRTASPAHADFGGLSSGAAPVVVRLDVVPLPPRSSSPTVAGCRLGGYPVGRDRWGGKRAAGGISEDNDRCF
jgi:hypothetical protein